MHELHRITMSFKLTCIYPNKATSLSTQATHCRCGVKQVCRIHSGGAASADDLDNPLNNHNHIDTLYSVMRGLRLLRAYRPTGQGVAAGGILREFPEGKYNEKHNK